MIKNAPLLLLLLLAPALARPAPPRMEPHQFWQNRLLRAIDKNLRLELAVYLPGFFGVSFLCQFRPADAEPVAVVPGDLIDAAKGGLLRCPDSIELQLEKGSRLRVDQVGRTPMLQFEAGAADFRFGEEPLFLSTPSFTLALQGRSRLQHMSLSLAQSEILRCDRGWIETELDQREDDAGKQLLENNLCRWDLGLARTAVTRYLHALDRIQVSNLLMPKKFWTGRIHPTERPPGFLEFNNIIHLAVPKPPRPSPDGRLALDWMLTGPPIGPKGRCWLLGQLNDSETSKVLQEFTPGESSTGTLAVDPAYARGQLSLTCLGEEYARSSPLLILDPSAPAR